jgi:hypothetical protein
MPSKKEACHEEIHFTLLYNEPNIGNSPEDREWELVDFEALIELDEKDADVKAVKKFTLPKEFCSSAQPGLHLLPYLTNL